MADKINYLVIEFLLWPLPPWCPNHVLILPMDWSSTSPLPSNVWPQRQVHLFQERTLALDISWLNAYSIRVWQFHLFSIPLVNCKSCVMIPRQHCNPPPPNPWAEYIDSKIHDTFIPSRFSLPMVSHTDRCIYFNTTHHAQDLDML